MSDIKTYYENYHETYKTGAYTASSAGHHSRMLALMEFIRQVTPLGGRIADIGCNDMYLASQLTEFKWDGVDICPPPTAPKEVIKHDLEVTPYPLTTGAYDTVVCSEVLEHLFTPMKVLSEANRALKKGGHIIISTPNMDHLDWLLTHHRYLLFDPDYKHSVEHIRWYNPEAHYAMLNKTGFRVLDRVGADAHYSVFFKDARIELKKAMPGKSDTEIDQLIGKCFRDNSHTIVVLARKEV